VSARLQQLQGAALDLFLDADGERAFAADPRAFAAARGLASGDAEAFHRFAPRLRLYRALVRGALEDPLPDCFPFTHQILEDAGAWEDCLDAFLASRSIQSPYYRDINPAFVAWLAESGWGLERWPFLLSLAHFEWAELEVLRWPEAPLPAGLSDDPAPERRVVFDGAARNLAYGWRVHESDAEAPVPAEGPALLFCHRDRDLDFRVQEMDGPASACLARCLEGKAIADAAEGFGLPEAQALLGQLRAEGAILGFS
jgi:hypothetical protein